MQSLRIREKFHCTHNILPFPFCSFPKQAVFPGSPLHYLLTVSLLNYPPLFLLSFSSFLLPLTPSLSCPLPPSSPPSPPPPLSLPHQSTERRHGGTLHLYVDNSTAVSSSQEIHLLFVRMLTHCSVHSTLTCVYTQFIVHSV